MNAIESLSKVGATGVALVIWVLAFFCVLGAVWEARKFATAQESIALAHLTKPPVIEVVDQDLSKEDYEKVVKDAKERHPNINFTYESRDNSITAASNDIAAYYDWLISIYTVMTSQPDARWSTISMCAGDGCPRSKYFITMTGKKRVPNVKGGVPTE